jgi:RNA-directed DNA polymerase
MRQQLRRRSVLHRYDLSLTELADRILPTMLGWIRYYGRCSQSALGQVLLAVDAALVHRARRKSERLRGRKVRAAAWLKGVKAR